MATITNDPDAPTYLIPLLGDLVLEPGESAEVTDEEAKGFLAHPHLRVTGLTLEAPPAQVSDPGPPPDAAGITEPAEVTE